MKPEQKSQLLLGVTRSKAKMFEYNVPEEYHIKITQDPSRLFGLSIGLLGDLAANINSEKISPDSIVTFKRNLLFSAHFFDAYLQSKLNNALDVYLILLGSASYYLCDLPGSAIVLANRIVGECPDLDGDGLEDLLIWLLQADLSTFFNGSKGLFGKYIDSISKYVLQFYKDGTGENNLLELANELRKLAYEAGTPRQLLFGDVITAVLRKKIQNSSWKSLPLYSDLPKSKWFYVLQKKSFIKELWPAQHLLGQANVLKGESAIVQMPTSAGKTKAIELIIRSGFLAERTTLAIIIAPFRALCHEIKSNLVSAFHNESTKIDELSDVLQTDFDIAELLGHQQILVVTPEKLLYVLRHAPELVSNVGLLIFDEGHQFDSGTRGITYELLLTSLRSMIPEATQKVLISAVISNAESVGEWLNGNPKVVEGTNLNPTFKSIGFTSWLDQLGRIEFVDSENVEQGEFFVPRVIESYILKKMPHEKKNRIFPEKSDGQAIALYLGLKLVPNGSVAIFCGRKSAAAGICEKAIEIIEHNVPFPLPKEFSNKQEIERLYNLYIENLGSDAPVSKSALYGIFAHHGNMPQGIRLAVEYAMREGLVHFVVCTSTLAQGVNLPIRYLIVTSVYQGIERIKVRDFHNLIGRAGRAGMHTEGSVLFADPIVYDKKNIRNENWRWKQVKKLLEPRNSEPCISNLLSIFEPIKSDDNKYTVTMEALDFVKVYISDPDEITRRANKIIQQHKKEGFSHEGVYRQVAWKINLISSIESFLLSHWDENGTILSEAEVAHLAENTLAFFLADEEKRNHIYELFKLIANNISLNITEPSKRIIYGRTLYGIRDAQSIEKWIQENITKLMSVTSNEEILNLIWPLLASHINNSVFKKFDKPNVLKEIAQKWIEGKSFYELFEIIQQRNAKMIWGSRLRDFKIDHIVDICENGFSYDSTLLIGALIELIGLFDMEDRTAFIINLQQFQKQLKYGLPNDVSILIYELGFSDRVISQEISRVISLVNNKAEVLNELKEKSEAILNVLTRYPKYYRNIFDIVTN